MLEQLDYEGKWWLPNKPNDPFPGSLTFSQDKGAVLSLMGSFDLIGEDISKHELILGETSDGKKITVVGKLSYSIYPYASSRSLIEFQRIFLGVHFLRPEDIKFDIVWILDKPWRANVASDVNNSNVVAKIQ
jgi:hypothetical protein